MRRALMVALMLVLVTATSSAATTEERVSPSKFWATHLWQSKSHVQAKWGTTGVRERSWTENGRSFREKRYKTTQGRGTWVLATYRHTLPGAAHQWSLVDKEWCVTADFGPSFYCRPRPYPW